MSAVAASPAKGVSSEFRLPTNVRPTHYDLTFKTDLEELTFKGFGTIDLDILEETKEIAFNASDISIADVSIHSEALKTEQSQACADLATDKEGERVTAKFGTPLPRGSKAKLRLGWEGQLKDSMMGYYRSCTTHEGKKRHYALTQGLITGRTSAFLFDESKSDLAAKKRVATVTSHECAHLWFGDLVTMEWWDNLWLNEGFATLMGEVIIIDKVFPEWKVDSEFIDAHLTRALDLDAVRSSHPIEVPVPDAKQINPLRMLANYVGVDTFLRGVAIYLAKHTYGNSVTIDLWKGIGEASGLDILKMMNNWILKIGYPVVTVKETPTGIVVRQDRFLATGDPTEDENQTIWQIPLNIKTVDASGTAKVDGSVLLTEREATIPLDTSRPFKLNTGTNGVYRVAYTPERLKKLGEEAARENSVFSLEDRMGLVSDALVLAKANLGKTSAALDLINSLRNDKEHLVWSAVETQLNKVNRILWEEPEEVRESWNAFRRSLFRPIVDRLGYENAPEDSTDTVELRTLAVAVCASAQDKEVIAELQSRFKHFMETGDESRIPPDLRKSTYVNCVRHGGRAEYEVIKKVYKNPLTPSAKIAAMYAMTAASDKELIDEMLAFILTDVQIQDTMYFFSGSSVNRHARRRIAQFLKDNYEKITKMFEGNFSLSYLIKFSFQELTTEKDAQDMEEFFKDKDTSKFNLVLAQSLDAIRANAKWLERSRDDITTWLAEWKKSSKL
ncbi:Aminopeptidase 2 mitochondrial [Tulasnella sp. 403]|nr:Aminopeptidase 2 mitochondrial [Tulasnella sp. 403]